MTLNSEIIKSALREANTIGVGADPTDAENVEGLALLQALTNTFPGAILDHKFTPWFIPTPFNTSPDTHNYPAQPGHQTPRPYINELYPPAGSRVVLRATTATTLYLQYQPQDGAFMQIVDGGFTADLTLDGNGGYFEGTGTDTTDVITATFGSGTRVPTRTYMYRADTNSWNRIDDLILEGEHPTPSELDELWSTGLAIRLAPRHGKKVDPSTVARFQEMVTYARGLYRQSKEVIVGDLGIPTEQTYRGRNGLGDPTVGRP